MDEQFENGIFSDFEREELNHGYIGLPELKTPKLSEQQDHLNNIELYSRKHSYEPINESKMNLNDIQQPYNSRPYEIKAFNPYQMVQKMPIQKQKEYLRIANNTKNFNGLQIFFSADDYNENQKYYGQDIQFLSDINEKVFVNNNENEPKMGDLNKLFSMHGSKQQTEKDHIRNMIFNLRNKMNQSQEKCFSSIMLNKTIGAAFYEHFQNFSLIANPINFLQDLQSNLTNFIHSAKRIKGPGIQLIYSIYQFWMKTFKDFVNQIWKHSQKYTLNFFKKQKNSSLSSHSQSTARKQQSSMQLNKQKRKNWTNDQIRVLQRIIESNVIFSQNKLKELAEELGRSVNSISSKIQKIIKSKKGEQYQEDSLLKKTIQVLKLTPQGLNKQTIIERINEYYEMGYDGQWQKSVGQLLSSRKQFNKIKGKYRLLQGQKYLKSKMQQQNIQKLTFRDKVIKCFLKFQNYETDLKNLIQMYLAMYGQQEDIVGNNQDRRKSIEASISKTLSRYDIFDTSNSKTIYQYVPGTEDTRNGENKMDQYHDYIDI